MKQVIYGVLIAGIIYTMYREFQKQQRPIIKIVE